MKTILKSTKPFFAGFSFIGAASLANSTSIVKEDFSKVVELMSPTSPRGELRYTFLEGFKKNPSAWAGRAVSSAGDFNGDGFDDLIVSASLAAIDNKIQVGQVYLIYGREGTPEIQLSTIESGQNGFAINGINGGDFLGTQVANNLGDVNGDGIDDIAIGAPSADPGGRLNAGQCYVLFGSKQKFSKPFDLKTLNGKNGFAINGISISDGASRINGAGDFNGDGFKDIIIGARRAKADLGQAYLVFGGKDFVSSLELNALNGKNGFKIDGVTPTGNLGYSVNSAGDINGDGFSDVVIGAPGLFNDPNPKPGSAYVIFGKESVTATFSLNTLDGKNGFKIDGNVVGIRLGESVSSAGDINADGFDDVVVGSPKINVNDASLSGKSTLIYGKVTGFSSVLKVNELSNNEDGFELYGFQAGGYVGESVARAGDINGDGLSDFMIGSYRADINGKTNAGQVYVIYGDREKISSIQQLSQLDKTNRFAINGAKQEDNLGFLMNPGGDFNGDGVEDFVIGAPGFTVEGTPDVGAAYLIYGRDKSPQGDFTENYTPDLVVRKPKKGLGFIPLILAETEIGIKTELGESSAIPDLLPSQNLPKKTKVLSALDFDDAGVSDVLVQTSRNQLKLYRLDNEGLPVSPKILGEVNYNIPAKHRYVAAGPLVGKDEKYDLLIKRKKSYFIVANQNNLFGSELLSLTGRVEGKILSIQKGKIITFKGRKISEQLIENNTFGTKRELGSLAKGQKPVAALDVNRDGKLDIITLGKKGSVGYVSENLSAPPLPILTLPKKTKIFRPK